MTYALTSLVGIFTLLAQCLEGFFLVLGVQLAILKTPIRRGSIIHHAVKPYPSGQGYKALKDLLGFPLNPSIAKMYSVHRLEVDTY